MEKGGCFCREEDDEKGEVGFFLGGGGVVLKKRNFFASGGIRKLVCFNEIKRPTNRNPVCNMFKNQIQSYKLLFLIFGPCCATLIHNKK
ncbi:unnamed protein product [Linum tenue]|uniref:Uncharacterized protein n=1 Tax=Linum tenue TaxID=586396 RepID=A0AAV0JZU9_9ROSI|nr:unnamed protein product [Linum tenue]